MSIIKEIKKYILLNKLLWITMLIMLLNLINIIYLMLINNIDYVSLSLLFLFISYSVGYILNEFIKNRSFNISETLYFMSISEKNKKQGIKLLISNNSIIDLLENMEVIQKVTENNYWLIENINKKQINHY